MGTLTLIFLIVYIFTLIRHKNVVRPNTIFTIVILAALWITSLRLSSHQSEYPIWFFLLIYCTIILFNFGGRVFRSYSNSNTEYLEQAIRFDGMNYYNGRVLKLIVVVMWLAVMLSVAVTIFVLGAPPAISLTSDRSEYFLSGWGSIYSLNTVLYALILFDRYQKKALGKFWNFIFTFSLYVVVFLMANKFQIFSLLLVYFVSRALLKKGQSLWKILIFVGAGLFIFVMMYNFIYAQMYNFSNEDTLYYYGVNLPGKYDFLANPYLYVATNFENLYHFINTKHHMMFGYCEIYNITRSFKFCDAVFTKNIGYYYPEYTDSLHMGAMNTGSMFLIPYRDFGIAGMLLYSFLCGIICGSIEKYVIKKKNFTSYFLYCYAMICVFMSFFTDSFLTKNMIINLIAAFVISKLIHEEVVFAYKGKTLKEYN